jgi:anti-sigma factor RsiW
MDHLQFEAMLFDVKDLKSAQRAELESHLASCSACRGLARALSQMEDHLAGASLVPPTEGFSLRFQNRLKARRRKSHERLFGLSVVAITAGIAALAVIFGGEALTLSTPLVSSGLKTLAEFLRIGSMFGLLGEFLRLLVENLVGNLSPAYLLVGSVAFSSLLALWIISLYRVNTLPVRKE